ncbi:MAG: hypothetical protein GOV02_03235 [Candidatus Aenigmarchaeota archaeon]|nr:hypothetical protein [Candidatus Aenigmarchaeota archaeon]
MTKEDSQPNNKCNECPDLQQISCVTYGIMDRLRMGDMRKKATEINELRDYLQSMHNDDTVEQSWDIYREKAIRYKELMGEEFKPKDYDVSREDIEDAMEMIPEDMSSCQ